MLAALLEAALGACYLDVRLRARPRADRRRAFGERIDYAITTHVDHKTELQEELARLGLQVDYALLDDGRARRTTRSFTTAALVDGEEAGVGTGPSKKAAEQAAAMEALARIRRERAHG